MQKLYVAAVSAALVTTLALTASKQGPADTYPVDHITEQFHRDLQQFRASTRALDSTAGRLSAESPRTLSALKQQFYKCRHAYKRIEYLAAYLDPDFVNRYINGAPLPKLEPHAPSLSILPPKGLQTIDEHIFGDAPYDTKTDLKKLTKKLVTHTEELVKYQRTIKFYDRNVFEAVRFQLVRIMTNGVTGFDAPASLNSLPEARASLEAMQTAMSHYKPLIKHESPELHKQLTGQFTAAIKMVLKSKDDFDSFDRLTFLKEHINPLFKTVLDVQLKLGIETYYETSTLPRAFNYKADNIFAEDFLNADFYVKVPEALRSPKVAELGKLLFFDPSLSANNERACASCHKPELAFTDGKAKSTAFDFKGTLDRNAPTVINSIYTERFFYDLRSDNLESQTDHVVANPREFHTSYGAIAEKLSKSDEYMTRFAEAYPRYKADPITKYTISTAITAYVRTLTGFDSEFDRYVRGETDHIDPAVKRGFNIFAGKAACATCHFIPVFNGTVPPFYTESETEVLGVPADSGTDRLDPDPGRYAGKLKERAPFYKHSFKTVTVRNAALTAPYMHNGAYQTLQGVMHFYNRGGGEGMGLDVPHQTLAPDSLGLTQREISDVIAFMNALTDTAGMTDPPTRLPEIPGIRDRLVGGEY